VKYTPLGFPVGLFVMNRKEFIAIADAAFHKWQANNASIRAAALAFFTILPLPSLLLILLGFFSLIYGQPQALQQLISQVNVLAGPTVADLVRQLVGSQSDAFTSTLNSAITITFAVIGAIGAFAVLLSTLNGVWEVEPQSPRKLIPRIRRRLFPFLIISSMGFIVVAWTGFTNVLFISIGLLLGSQASLVLGAGQIILSFLLTTLLFSIIYKQLPDIEIEWRDVTLAAIITSIVSTTLNYLFGIYIHTFPATSLLGTAGAVIVLMLWIFITDEFILFGAQFSRTYTEKVGSRFKKQRNSV
jgi:membrane protein